jgi:hypothetical protein
MRIVLQPLEHDAPLVIDPDRVKLLQVAMQLFQSIRGRDSDGHHRGEARWLLRGSDADSEVSSMAFRNPNSAFARYHSDGAREIIWERSRGRTAYDRFEMRSGIAIERRDLFGQRRNGRVPSYTS